MQARHFLIAGALVAGAFAAHTASAASLSPQATLPQSKIESSLVEQAQWRYCRRWRNECADRWGWRTRGFYRCLARRGCA